MMTHARSCSHGTGYGSTCLPILLASQTPVTCRIPRVTLTGMALTCIDVRPHSQARACRADLGTYGLLWQGFPIYLETLIWWLVGTQWLM